VPPVTLTLLVQPDGYLSAVDAHDAQRVDVSIALAGDTLAAFLQGGQAAVMKHVKIEGDAGSRRRSRSSPSTCAGSLRKISRAGRRRGGAPDRDGRARRRRTRAAPAATCSIPSPSTGSTRTRKSSGAPRSAASTPNWRGRAMRSRASRNGSSDSNKIGARAGSSLRGAH
jgi:ubiquinone biosynthesis protein UbiJ